MKKSIAFLAALALLLTCGCGAQKEEPTTAPADTASDATAETPAQQLGFQFTLDNYPRMGGSLANLPLGEAVTASVESDPS